MNTNKYFKDFFKEKENIQDFSFTTVKDGHIFNYDLTKEDILKIILNFSEDIKLKIMEKFIYIDFKNGDINHFLEYLLKGYCEEDIKQQLKVYQENKSIYI